MDRITLGSSGEREDMPALRALLRRRSQGAFISADEMDERLARMVDQKRRDHLPAEPSGKPSW